MSHWNHHARQWQKIGPPLRPQMEDLDFLTRTVATPPGSTSHPYDILLLGVTPEITALPWPIGSRLMAVDHCQDMIREVWRPNATIQSRAIQGDWCQLPAADHSFDLIVGDGCMTLMDAEQGMKHFLREIRRVLRPSGRLALRLFVRPEITETPELVFTDLRENRIENFHIFKWRLLMALHGSLHEGVLVSKAWDCWQQSVSDDSKIVACTGWDRATLATLGAYRDSTARYFFPTLKEARGILSQFLTEKCIQTPNYELGHCCPTVIYSAP